MIIVLTMNVAISTAISTFEFHFLINGNAIFVRKILAQFPQFIMPAQHHVTNCPALRNPARYRDVGHFHGSIFQDEIQ
jgi:hypothetical protein